MSKILKRISCFAMTFLLVFTSVFSTFAFNKSDTVIKGSAETDSNDRRKALIHMAAGKNATDLNKDGELSLTDEELQTIGIFLSNFYKPMQTCVNATDTEMNKKLEEQEINALVSCGFDKEIAGALAKAVKKYSSTTAADKANKLSIAIDGPGGNPSKGHLCLKRTETDYKNINKENIHGKRTKKLIEDATLSNFLYAASMGGSLFLRSTDENKEIIYFGRYNASLAGAELPSSTAMMLYMMLECSDPKEGTLNGMIHLLESSINGADAINGIKEKLKDSEMNKLYASCNSLSIDCFGNIISDCGTAQYVLVPACMNPYVFQSKGKGDSTIKTYVASNFQTITNASSIVSGTEYKGYDSSKKEATIKGFSFNSDSRFVKSWYSEENMYWYLSNNKSTSNVVEGKFNYATGAWNNIKSVFGYGESAESVSIPFNYGMGKYIKISDKDADSAKKRQEGALKDASITYLLANVSPIGGMVFGISAIMRNTIGDNSLTDVLAGTTYIPGESVLVTSDMFTGTLRLPCPCTDVARVSAIAGLFKSGEYYDKDGKLYEGIDTKMLTLDDLGTYEGDDTSGDSIQQTDVLTLAGAVKDYMKIDVSPNADAFYTTIQDGGKTFAQNIFLTYVYMFANYKNNTWDSRGITCKLNLGDALPKPNCKGVFDGIEIDTTQQLLDEGLSLAVLWMHPEKGLKLVTAWVNNKVSAILTGVHEKILGSNIANNTTATNKYIGFSGYVTMPELNDLSWTSAMLEKYNSYSVLIIVIMIILLFGYAMIGRIAPFKIVTTGLIFAFLMALPPVLINGTISITNQFSDRLYGQKFLYWGLVQHENYINEINQAASEGTYEDYLTTLFRQRYEENNSTNNNVSIRLKWMCPKKDNYVKNLKETVEGDTGSAFFSQIVGSLSNSSGITHEDYSESDNKVYLYRSYTDISNWSRYTYKAYAGVPAENWVEQSVEDMPSVSKYISDNMDSAKELGFTYKGVDEDPMRRVKPLNCSETIKDFLGSYTSSDEIKKKANLDTFLGMRTDSFKSLKDINDENVDNEDLAITYFSEMSESPFYYFAYNLYDQGMNWEDDNATEGFKCLALNESFSNANSATDKDVTEGDDTSSDSEEAQASPEVADEKVADTLDELKGQDGSQEPAEMGDETNDGYFYNMSQGIVEKGGRGYGEIRDYMDMRTLFTVVIPYLKKCNQMVLDYDKAFGLRTYDGYSYDPGDADNYDEKEDKRKFWVNVCTAQMFNLYTPWVDAMYDCKYAKSDSVRVAGKKEFVDDPLNPADYPESRPMIFSESERVYYGIKESQLTDVEKKIIGVQKNSYERLFQLMNYYTFHDTVVTSAAAMVETFEFNKTFSQNSLLSDSYVLYPQAYELKNFSYDAFLRLILSQATGEDIQASASDGGLTDKGGSIYERVVKNSNMFCGIMLIINDAICIWLIPLAKFAFLILIFAMSILMLVSCIIKVDIDNMQMTITKSLLTPLAKFLLLTIGHSFIVSCFMSEGNTAVTGVTSPAITLGDPTMTLILMAVINGVVIVIFFKILLKLIHDSVTYAKAIGQDIVGMAGGVLTMATNSIRGAYNSAKGAGRSLVGAGLFAAGTAVAAGMGIKKGINKLRGGSGSGGGSSASNSDGSKSSTEHEKTAKTKDNSKQENNGENKYDNLIKDGKSNVKEATTSENTKSSKLGDVASKGKEKIKGVASKDKEKIKNTAGNIKDSAHARVEIAKDRRETKKDEKFMKASPEKRRKMLDKEEKHISRQAGRKAFAQKVNNKAGKAKNTVVGAAKSAKRKVVNIGTTVTGGITSGKRKVQAGAIKYKKKKKEKREALLNAGKSAGERNKKRQDYKNSRVQAEMQKKLNKK